MQAQVQLGALPGRIWGQLSRPVSTATYLQPPSVAPNLVEGRELYGPQSVAVDLSTGKPALFVADTQNNRVLIWKDASKLKDDKDRFGVKADIVIGQPDFYSTTPYGTTSSGGHTLATFSSGLNSPSAVAVDSQANLWVFDSGNNRVVRYPKVLAGAATGQKADLVLGQPSLTANFPNQSTGFNSVVAPTEYTLSSYSTSYGVLVGGLAFNAAGDLYIADTANHRILVFDHSAVLQSGDTGNPVSHIAAREVIGQADFITAAANPGTATSSATALASVNDRARLRFPTALAFDSTGNLFVTDAMPRVLVYASSAQVRGGTATRVVGILPSNLSTPATAVNAYSLGAMIYGNTYIGGAAGLFVANDSLYVCDTLNNRVLQFGAVSTWPAETSAVLSPTATAVYGQTGFAGSAVNGSTSGLPLGGTFSSPAGAAYAGNVVYIADAGNNRVLVFDSLLKGTASPNADRLVGQVGLTYGAPNLLEGREFGSSTISWSYANSSTVNRTTVTPSIAYDRTHPYVYISDPANHRILAYADYRKFNGTQIADIVIGQVDASSNAVNSPTNDSTKPNATGLNTPTGIAVDAHGNLWVADTGNARVVRYPAPFEHRDAPNVPDIVLGKSDFTSTFTENSATSLQRPVSLAFSSAGDLYVADVAQSRVLRFANVDAASNGAAADLVLGQPDFSTITAGTSKTDLTTIAAPTSIAMDAVDRLYVVDPPNYRILVWDTAQVAGQNGAPASSPITLLDQQAQPIAVTLYPDADTGNQRLLYSDTAGRVVTVPGYVSQTLLGATIDPKAIIGSYGARSMQVDVKGNVYISDSASRIAVHYDSAALTNVANGFTMLAPLTLTAYKPTGTKLASTPVSVSAAPYPTTLGGFQLLVNGTPAPIYSVSEDTVKFVMPNATPTNTANDFSLVSVDTGEEISYTRAVVYVAAPAFMKGDAVSGGYLIQALNSDGTANSSSNPAKAGSDVTLLMTGVGNLTGAPADGNAGAVAVPLTAGKDYVAMGTSLATVKSSTLDATLPGVWRITVTVPSNAGSKPAIPVATGMIYKGIIANMDPTTGKNAAAYASGVYVLHN